MKFIFNMDNIIILKKINSTHPHTWNMLYGSVLFNPFYEEAVIKYKKDKIIHIELYSYEYNGN